MAVTVYPNRYSDKSGSVRGPVGPFETRKKLTESNCGGAQTPLRTASAWASLPEMTGV